MIKKGLSWQVKNKTTRQDLNHAFILGTPVHMVANNMWIISWFPLTWLLDGGVVPDIPPCRQNGRRMSEKCLKILLRSK
jgi:hypothetical protein